MAITRIGNPAIADQRGVNFRNIIINGGMDLAQRGTSTTGLQNSPEFLIDRWSYRRAGTFTSATFSMAQSTDVPTGQGFTKSAKIDCTATESSLPADVFAAFNQAIEGQMLQYLKKGTSNAESLALSFWVKSNKTGTYTFELFDQDNTRSISKSYTISSADTWEKKTITFPADTTGTLDNDNAASFQLYWYLCAGSNFTSGTLNTSWTSRVDANRAVGQVNLADNTSNEWYITGVQLETGQVASDFEFLPYDVTFRRCQRYYHLLYRKEDATVDNACSFGIYGVYYTNTNVYFSGSHPVAMRASPSLDMASGTDYYRLYRAGALDTFDDFTLQTTNNRTNRYSWEANNTTDVSGTQGQTGILRGDIDTYVGFDAEL
jgi:hypothetical protein